MAFGFPAHDERTIDVPPSLDTQAIIAALRSLNIAASVSPDGQAILGSTNISFWSWSEHIIIRRPTPNSLLIRSECALPTQCIDWGRNATNTFNIARALLSLHPAPAPPAPPPLPSRP